MLNTQVFLSPRKTLSPSKPLETQLKIIAVFLALIKCFFFSITCLVVFLPRLITAGCALPLRAAFVLSHSACSQEFQILLLFVSFFNFPLPTECSGQTRRADSTGCPLSAVTSRTAHWQDDPLWSLVLLPGPGADHCSQPQLQGPLRHSAGKAPQRRVTHEILSISEG